MPYKTVDVFGRSVCIIYQETTRWSIQREDQDMVLHVTDRQVIAFSKFRESVHIEPVTATSLVAFNGIRMEENVGRTLPQHSLAIIDGSNIMINTAGIVPQFMGGEILSLDPLLAAAQRQGEENLSHAVSVWKQGILADTTGLDLVANAIYDKIIREIGYTVVSDLEPDILNKVVWIKLHYSVGDLNDFPEGNLQAVARYPGGDGKHIYLLEDQRGRHWILTLKLRGINAGYLARLKFGG